VIAGAASYGLLVLACRGRRLSGALFWGDPSAGVGVAWTGWNCSSRRGLGTAVTVAFDADSRPARNRGFGGCSGRR